MTKLYQSDILSSSDLDVETIRLILKTAKKFKKEKPKELLKGKILASLFFEPSTRTRFSFEAAMLRLGGNVIGCSDAKNTAIKKGESLSDMIRVVESYSDVIAMRHPLEGSARLASEVAEIPVINAGDGKNQHPTQTLLDLFTIEECQKKLNGLSIAFAGDLKYGRTVHSLALACSLFKMRLYFISPQHLSMPEDIFHELRRNQVKYSFHQSIKDVIGKLDVLYMTRLQKERHGTDAVEVKNYCLNTSHLSKAKANLRVLHPLPRVDEIDVDVDSTKHAYYFEQAENGLYVRQALLALLLRKPV